MVIAVTLGQLGHFAAGGRRLLPGSLGICAIPTLSIFCGMIISMTAGARVGLASGLAALVLLGILRVWESRRF